MSWNISVLISLRTNEATLVHSFVLENQCSLAHKLFCLFGQVELLVLCMNYFINGHILRNQPQVKMDVPNTIKIDIILKVWNWTIYFISKYPLVQTVLKILHFFNKEINILIDCHISHHTGAGVILNQLATPYAKFNWLILENLAYIGVEEV